MNHDEMEEAMELYCDGELTENDLPCGADLAEVIAEVIEELLDQASAAELAKIRANNGPFCPQSTTAATPCSDCKGSGQYTGLGFHGAEPCRSCQ